MARATAYVRTIVELRDIASAELRVQFNEHAKVYEVHGRSLECLFEQVVRFPSWGRAIDALHEAADNKLWEPKAPKGWDKVET